MYDISERIQSAAERAMARGISPNDLRKQAEGERESGSDLSADYTDAVAATLARLESNKND